MSLEQALAANTAALVALAAALQGASLATKADAAAPTPDAPAEGKAGKAGKADKPAKSADKPAPGMTAEELTASIVAAVKTHGKEAVLKLLKDDFGVAAGREITDPATRKQAADKLAAMAAGGEDDLG